MGQPSHRISLLLVELGLGLTWSLWIDKQNKLHCCLEQNVEKAQIRKTNTYTYFKNDLEDKGFTVDLVPFEIGSRGHVSKGNYTISSICLLRTT